MARQEVNIGIEGNDATGDSIRESFRKVNENFQEIYAIFGVSGTLSFISLGDVGPAEGAIYTGLIPNTLPFVNGTGSQINLLELASNSALGGGADDTITFDYSVAGKLVISSGFTKLSDDQQPRLGRPLNVGNNAIANVAISESAVTTYNQVHTGAAITIDDLVITKGYADRRYITSGLPIRVADEPENTDSYFLTVNRYISGNIEVIDHGFQSNQNGTPFIFTSVYSDPAALISEDTYYLRYETPNLLSVHETKETAQFVDNTEAAAARIFLTGSIAEDDTHLFTDAAYDENLEGNFLDDVAVPRKSAVRRQGDTMEGVLTLNDHPGDLSGFDIVNGIDDLQAATKFYVDNSGYSSTQNLFVSTDGDDKMNGVPPGREGTAYNYAYRTINQAARRAEEIIRASEPEPGPYFQTLTTNNGQVDALIDSAQVFDPQFPQTRLLLELNREYIINETVSWVNFTFPDFIYDQEICERDIGLILDAIIFDVNRGVGSNFLTRRAAEKYYASASGRYAITSQATETLGAINFAKELCSFVLENELFLEKSVDSIFVEEERARVTTTTNHGLTSGQQVIFKNMGGMTEIEGQSAYVKVIDEEIFELYTDPDLLFLWDISSYTPYTTNGKVGLVFQPRINDFNSIKLAQTFDAVDATPTGRSSVNTLFNLVNTILTQGIDAGAGDDYGSTYEIVFDAVDQTFLDQSNPTNVDTLPGKIMVGKVSGAKGRIVEFINNDTTKGINKVSFQLVQLNGKDFLEGEPVQYGNFVKQKQITIFVESGIYEEDYPIRLANNVSLKGDEFRRVIIRPKKRVSQSPWADMYFFRDKEFDGMEVATGGAPFFNQVGDLQGYIGRHYLADPERDLNVGELINNAGNYNTSSEILQINKEFLKKEIIYYVNNNYQDLLYNKSTCIRDLNYILDAVAYDIGLGTNYNAVISGRAYLRANYEDLEYDKENTLLALNRAKAVVGALPDVIADTTALSRSNSAFDEVIDIITNGIDNIDAITYPTPIGASADSIAAKDQLQNNRSFISSELSAWVDQTFPFFDYDREKFRTNVDYIIDGLSYDLLYGGNSATVTVARSYYEGTRSLLGVGEDATTVLAYQRLDRILQDVMQGSPWAATEGNNQLQDFSAGTASSSEINDMSGLLQVVIDVIDQGGTGNLPSPTYPSVTWTTQPVQDAVSEIISSKTSVTDNVILYLDNNIVFTYDTEKCERDVGLIVDAISKDLKLGGYEFSLEAQGDYYYNYINGFNNGGFGAQKDITKAAIQYINTLGAQLLAGVAPPQNSSVVPDTSLGVAPAGASQSFSGLIDIMLFAFDPNYNPPKRNDENGVDVFMMSDATIIRNVTVQGHGGFMCVLDPEGQILTKSPYIQTGSSFSRSSNAKRFRGGMYVDAFTGNIPATIVEVENPFKLRLESDLNQGLFVRPPELPCPFYIDGIRYQVNAISNYDQANGTVIIYIDSSSNPAENQTVGRGYLGSTGQRLFLQTAGNRSILGNDFTQINDLGYGLVTNNGALSEMVSMFTYYCQAAYYASNGSEIRSTNGSNGYGFFGLIAEGADPNEIPDQVTLAQDMVYPAEAFASDAITNAFDSATITVTNLPVPPKTDSIIVIDHLPAGVLVTVNNIGAPDLSRTAGTYTGVIASSGTGSNATFDVEVDGTGRATVTVVTGGENYEVGDTLTIVDADLGGGGAADLTFDVENIGRDAGRLQYRISSVQDLTDSGVTDSGNTISDTVYELTLRADEQQANDFFGSLQDFVLDGDIIEYRDAFSVIFDGVRSPSRLVTRPSTAINYDESDNITYRSLAFQDRNSINEALNDDQIYVSVDVQYGYVELIVSQDFLANGYGSAQGDTKLAVEILEDAEEIRVTRDIAGRQPGDLNYAKGTLFTYDGKKHQITNYTKVSILTTTGNVSVTAGETLTQDNSGATCIALESVNDSEIYVYDVTGQFNTDDEITGSVSGSLGANSIPASFAIDIWGFVEFDDVPGTNINPDYSGTGLNSAIPVVDLQTNDPVTLFSGLAAGSTGEITIAISLCRATGHDFTQIGTGGFNTSNYPNVILGDPELSLADSYSDSPNAISAQVWERRKGRVFWMSTDQFGFFRVGKFFEVDQAQGSIAFSGDIGITNANELGFKLGTKVNEFSVDSTFSDNSPDAVPTERAIGSYINLVLGYNVKTGAQILAPTSGQRIGPGFLALNGDTPMEGTLNMGAEKITNLALPGTDGSAATNKNYVDEKVSAFDQLEDLRNMEINSPVAKDLLIATGYKRIVTTTTSLAVGDYFGIEASKVAIIIDKENVDDSILGNVTFLTYEPLEGLPFITGETLYELVGTFADPQNPDYLTELSNNLEISCVIEDGPIDEFANATKADGSVINWTVARDENGATVDFQIEDNTIENADINSSAAISQSKLDMQRAGVFDEDDETNGWNGTADKVQSDLGLAVFSDENFEVKLEDLDDGGSDNDNTGYVRIKDNGIIFAELKDIPQYHVYGRQTAGSVVSAGSFVVGTEYIITTPGDTDFTAIGADDSNAGTIFTATSTGSGTGTASTTGDPQAVSYAQVVANGGGLADIDFTTTAPRAATGFPGSALIELEAGTYSKTTISEGTGANTMARRDNSGYLDAAGIKVGGFDTLEVSGTAVTLKTPGAGTILSSTGGTGSVVTTISSDVDIGSTGVEESVFQAGSAYSGENFLAVDWTYTSFIEAPGERGTGSTGISIGTETGFTSSAADTIIHITGGNERLVIGDSDTSVKNNLVVEGNTTLGNATTDTITVTGRINSDVNPNVAGERDLGSSGLRWDVVWANIFNGVATEAKYADLAENYLADNEYESGTVLIFGGEDEITTASSLADPRVAGVVSTNPAHLMNSELKGNYVTALALQGRVPCKVIGRVRKGDMLVTSATPGYAIVTTDPKIGTVIGKALENKDTVEKGVIEIVVGRV